MRTEHLQRFAGACFWLCSFSMSAWGYASGPPNGLTGAPGEYTCARCHGDGGLNTGGGRFRIATLTPNYVEGDTLTLAVALEQLGQRRWGFELTGVNHNGQRAGSILVTDARRTQLTSGHDGRQYLKHTLEGTDNGVLDSSPGWTFRWIPPPTGSGNTTFYATGNAANGNSSSGIGDYVYTAILTVGELVAIEPKSWASIKGLFR